MPRIRGRRKLYRGIKNNRNPLAMIDYRLARVMTRVG